MPSSWRVGACTETSKSVLQSLPLISPSSCRLDLVCPSTECHVRRTCSLCSFSALTELKFICERFCYQTPLMRDPQKRLWCLNCKLQVIQESEYDPQKHTHIANNVAFEAPAPPAPETATKPAGALLRPPRDQDDIVRRRDDFVDEESEPSPSKPDSSSTTTKSAVSLSESRPPAAKSQDPHVCISILSAFVQVF